ncbi:MAG TPA: hypothetical protein VGL42_12540 [Opitutaceae bacterium]|jgi:hypothetical protein
MHLKAFRFQRRDGTSTVAARVTGVAAVLLIGVLLWLSADPEAHERFHHDAGHEDHHCVVTDFAMGEGYFVAPTVVVAPVKRVFGVVQIAAVEAARVAADVRLEPSRGPPRAIARL